MNLANEVLASARSGFAVALPILIPVVIIAAIVGAVIWWRRRNV